MIAKRFVKGLVPEIVLVIVPILVRVVRAAVVEAVPEHAKGAVLNRAQDVLEVVLLVVQVVAAGGENLYIINERD